MPPARKRGSQEQGRRLQAYAACHCHCGCFRQEGQGCRQRQMTTTNLHGSLSFIDLKNRMKKPTPSRNFKRGGGLSLLLWVQTEADDDDEPTWLVVVIVVRCLKDKDPPPLAIASEGVGGFASEETHPGLQLHARGWAFVICIALSLSVISNIS